MDIIESAGVNTVGEVLTTATERIGTSDNYKNRSLKVKFHLKSAAFDFFTKSKILKADEQMMVQFLSCRTVAEMNGVNTGSLLSS